jgi:hypothetical protein
VKNPNKNRTKSPCRNKFRKIADVLFDSGDNMGQMPKKFLKILKNPLALFLE